MNKQSAILTEQDFRDAISKQCGFPLQLEETTQPEERVFDGEDAEEWQYQSERQGAE